MGNLSRTILCAAVACTKAGTIPKNRGKPNGWRYAEYLVNRGDGRWLLRVEARNGQDTLLCPSCAARQDRARASLALQAAEARVEAQAAAQAALEASQEAEKASAQAAQAARRAETAPEGYTSWAPEVIADGSGVWAGNALRFATRGEAEDNVRDLFMRWTLVRETRVVPSTDPVKYTYSDEGLKQV